ncbi:1-phosphofructokinase [Macrococcus equipercicus]|uniref:Tagatose-6-phosphate kinase n=1 Tax=Macrococcus equipercicus TaxID=69967 RepID=A0A9Q9F3M4_9STAP|nr:1-phosphofructokinase [Macrococcus equipercicus]KAA1042408.1 1-phosphofructokinase [Macrococcus equipercicus]UTH14294.1 1-phosphofructokinase [Macrococcus equipercicus]
MIYTVTLNPSIDYVMFTSQFELGALNRAAATYKFAGGKGINVSRVLKEHGVDSVALGFTGGFPGKFIEHELIESGIQTAFVNVDGDTRINVKLKGGSETEINAPGPEVTKAQEAAFLAQLEQLTGDDLVIISGSVPGTLDQTIYSKIAQRCTDRDVKFVVDAEKELLDSVLSYGPEFVKPNKVELEEMFGETLDNDTSITQCARKLMAKGAKQVLVSLGGDGALLVTDTLVLKAVVPSGRVINTVGSGDSTVAGMIAGLANNESLEDSFRRAVASGTATAFTEDLAQQHDIDKIMEQITITTLMEAKE